jgi:hypothetical protein
MKRASLLLCLIFALVALRAESIEEFIKTLPISEVKVLEREAFYSHIYELMFTQALDHENPEAGSFEQRLYISHVDVNQPVVLITEGYTADYYYTSEVSHLLKSNQIIAEHRYFGKSQPDSVQWEYLTTRQAATDHHKIIEAFKKFYTGKWITTGISKGGQTVMFHSYYYPDDVDARVPYVAPLNYALEDERIYTFLDNVGSKKCRRAIHKFQKMALHKQDEIFPEFKKYADKKGYTFELVGGDRMAYEYCVLEYSFAFWQWGYASCSDIPSGKTSAEDIIIHMNQVAGFDYFADKFVLAYQPFFFQANTEMGYYGYDLKEFEHQLRYVTDPGFSFTMPKNYPAEFSDKLLVGLTDYIVNEAENFLYIYGEYDTWSATAVELNGATNSRAYFKEKGSHRTRIRDFSDNKQEEILEVLHSFLE